MSLVITAWNPSAGIAVCDGRACGYQDGKQVITSEDYSKLARLPNGGILGFVGRVRDGYPLTNLLSDVIEEHLLPDVTLAAREMDFSGLCSFIPDLLKEYAARFADTAVQLALRGIGGLSNLFRASAVLQGIIRSLAAISDDINDHTRVEYLYGGASARASAVPFAELTADMITTGTLDASAVDITNINASNITTGTLFASKVIFADGTSVDTAARVQNAMYRQQNTATTSGASQPGTPIQGLSFTVTVSADSSKDVFNIFGGLSGGQTSGTVGAQCNVNLYVDGVFNQAASVSYATLNGTQSNSFIMSITGLASGSHTFTFYLQSSLASATFQSYAGTNLLCQHFY